MPKCNGLRDRTSVLAFGAVVYRRVLASEYSGKVLWKLLRQAVKAIRLLRESITSDAWPDRPVTIQLPCVTSISVSFQQGICPIPNICNATGPESLSLYTVDHGQ